jgi:hypothetical protein
MDPKNKLDAELEDIDTAADEDVDPAVDIDDDKIDQLDEKINSLTMEFIDELISKLEVEINDEVKTDLGAKISEILREMYNLGKSDITEVEQELSPEELEELDGEYRDAVERVTTKMEKFYTSCLEKTKQKVAKKICDVKEKNKAGRKKLIESVNSFINSFVTEKIKPDAIIESEEVARLKAFYDSIRNAVFVHNDEIKKTITEKVSEIDSVVKVLKEKYTESIKDRIVLKEKLASFEKGELIREAIEDLEPKLARNVRRRLLTESVESIKKDTEKIITEERKILDVEDSELINESNSNKRPKELITESSTGKTGDPAKSVMDVYAEESRRLLTY